MQQNLIKSTQKIVGQSNRNLSGQLTSGTGLLAVLILVACGAVVVVHWPALSSKAISFDDHQYLVENPLVQNPSWTSARRFLTEVLEPSTVDGYYQPLAMLSLMADYALGGRVDNLRPFHRTSLALHAANTALVIVLLYLLFGRVWIAAGAGLLFGLHPLTVEPVCWISDRKSLLAAFFALWSLIIYVRFTRGSSRLLYVGCLVIYILALMSKPTSIPVPVLMLLMDFWPLRRLSWRTVIEKLPFFVGAAVFAVITCISQGRTAIMVLPGKYGPWRIPLIVCHNVIFYLYKIVWPANLTTWYAYPEPLGLSNPMVLAGIVGTCVLVVLLLVSLRWTRGLLTGWLFFFVGIFPAVGVIGFTFTIASDRYTYLPSVGLLMAMVSFLGWLCYGGGANSKWKVQQAAVVIVTVLALSGAEAVATQRYLVYWRNTITLYEHMLALAPNASELHNNLGYVLVSQGKLDDAIEHYHRALELKPDYAEAHYNLGNALASQGKVDEAISHYHQAIELAPDDAVAYYNLGTILQSQGKINEAVSYYHQALQIEPDSAEVYNNLGVAFETQGRLDKAIEHYRQALQVNPDYVESCNNLAWILATQQVLSSGDVDEAIGLAERAARLTSRMNVTVLGTLAASYAAAGQFERAITTAQEALELAIAAHDYKLARHLRKQIELYRQQKPIQKDQTENH